MAAINNIEDFLKVVREDAGVRSAVRREILTEDLLGLPRQFEELLKTQNALRQDTNALQETQNAILDTLAVLRAQGEMKVSLRGEIGALRDDVGKMEASLRGEIGALRDDVGKMEVSLRGDIGALHGILRQQQRDFGRFRGHYAVEAATSNRAAIAGMFSQRRCMRKTAITVLDSAALDNMLNENYNAIDALGLEDAIWETFTTSDLIFKVAARQSSIPGFYIAVEASFTGNDNDVSKATGYAKILRCATGWNAYAVVAAVRLDRDINRSRIIDDFVKYIEANDEKAAFWYQLVEEDLEPEDPR